MKRFAIVCLVGFVIGYGTSASAWDKTCQPVIDMIQRQNSVEKMKLVNRYSLPNGKIRQQEYIVTKWKLYSHFEKGPWRIERRELTPADAVSNCSFIGADTVSGILTKIYEYDRRASQTRYRVRMWIGQDSGLPIRSHWITTNPPGIRSQRDSTYFYGADLKEPI